MREFPLVSIIVVNYNGKRYLKPCFDSLLAQTHKNSELIFVDNGSQDGSLELVRNHYPQVKVVDNRQNLGLAIASNRGAKEARGKYLFFFNNDTIADKHMLEYLVRTAESDETIGICGCRTLTYKGDAEIVSGVPCDIFGYPFAQGPLFYVDAAIFIRRDLFDALAGFDEEMFLYGEDRDICWRCWLYGYKVVRVPEAFFFHDSACITQDLRDYQTNIRKRFWGEFNALRAILKNYSLLVLVFILPLHIGINIAEMLLFLLMARKDVVREAYLKVYRKNWQLLPQTLRLRRLVQTQRKVSDLFILRKMSKVSGKLMLFLRIGLPKVWR